MNQPPGGGYPPGPPYPGQPGYPQQGFPQQPPAAAQPPQAQVGQPGAAKPFMGTALMPGAPAIPGMPAQQPQMQQPPQAQPDYGQPQQQQYGQPAYGQAPQQQQYGQPPQQGQYGQAPQQAQYGQQQQQQGQYGQPQQPYGQPPGGYGQPGQAGQPGAMQQQAPQAGGMPQFGVGGFGSHGMPRINVSGGDFSPAKLVGAITTGQGFEKPRKMGMIMVALAFALAIGNSVLVFVLHRYYPYLYSIGAIFWWAGWWLLVTGQPKHKADGTPAPMWARIGLAGCLVMGVLVGAAMCFFNWEHMLANNAIE